MVSNFIVKDAEGSSGSLGVWGKIKASQFIPGAVLELLNLKVDDYPKDGPPRTLSTTSGTVIRNAVPKIQQQFENISQFDGTVEGEVEVFYGLTTYESCPNSSFGKY